VLILEALLVLAIRLPRIPAAALVTAAERT
jgi:hypothetical protein